MSERQTWVVDVETTGLDISRHVPIEVAAVNLDSGEEIYFVPHLTDAQLLEADKDALRINRYFERGVYRDAAKSTADGQHRWIYLWGRLRGGALAGANPRFDAAMLLRGYAIARGYEVLEPWHHRLPDASSYTAGALGIHPGSLPGLDRCCALLGVDTCPHGALEDARATAEVYRRAMKLSASRDAVVSL